MMSAPQRHSTRRKGTSVLRALTLLALAAGLSGQAMEAQNSGSGTAPANPYSVMAPGVVGPQGPGMQSVGGIMNSQTPMNGVGGVMGAQQGAQPQAGGGTALYPDPKQYVLNPGDLIYVRLYGSGDYASTNRISSDGTIELPLIKSVDLSGLTIRQGEELIDQRLRTAGMYPNPDILITLGESVSPQAVTLSGEMHGIYPVQGRRMLLDVLSASGGLPVTAGRTIDIIRPGLDAPIVVNLGDSPQEMVKANVPVLPHDTIFVERLGVVYLVGAFRSSGAFPMQVGRTTLMQVASLAGGPSYEGKYSDMRLIRTEGSQRTEVKVDIKKVLFGKEADPILHAGDIIFLPTNQIKAAISNGGVSALLSAISVLLIATVQR